MIKVKRKSFKKRFLPYVIFFIVFVLIIIITHILDFSDYDIITAAHGEIIDGFETKALIIRDEKNIKSPAAGKVNLSSLEGDRISTGTKVAEISLENGNLSIYNKIPGILSYATDGLESTVIPSNMNKLDLNNIEKYKGNYRHLISGNKIEQGKTLYRIINNFRLFLIVPAEKEEAERFRINEIIFLTEQKKTDLIRGRIIDITEGIDKSFIFVKMDIFVPKWINIRWIDINFIKNIYRGIKIPRSAVFTQPSGQGVLKLSGYNKHVFQEVIVVDGDQENVIVKGLEVGVQVIVNPEDFNYGIEE
nr:HlyD family efflux transporter periplasmic adaptor subunit [Halanaerobium sp. DL-01]